MPLAEAVDLEPALDEVFATPPEGFVKARDALVKRLRAEKRRDEAEAVATLRRPNRLVWALDQLALEDDPSLAALLDAVADVRDASGGDLRSAVAALREAVSDAAAAAAARLDPRRPSDRADLGAALHSVVADEAAVEELQAGRLLELPEVSAFGFPAAADSAPAKGTPKPKGKAKPKAKAEPDEAVGPDPLAVKRAEKAEKAAAKANDTAQRALARAEAALADAESEVDTAGQAVREAEQTLDRALEAQAAAEETHDRARADAETAAEELEQARDALAELTRGG
jgi:hypothetical protein